MILMKCDGYNMFHLLKEKSIPYSIQTCYVGLKSNLLSEQDVHHCINTLLEKDLTNSVYINIIVDNYSTESLLKAMRTLNLPIPSENDATWLCEIRKLRYTLLYTLSFGIQAPSAYEALLERIAILYADFGYSSDMEHLIYYMPPEGDYDPTKYSIEQNREHLVLLLHIFLKKEERALNKS